MHFYSGPPMHLFSGVDNGRHTARIRTSLAQTWWDSQRKRQAVR